MQDLIHYDGHGDFGKSTLKLGDQLPPTLGGDNAILNAALLPCFDSQSPHFDTDDEPRCSPLKQPKPNLEEGEDMTETIETAIESDADELLSGAQEVRDGLH
ncbi:uncharacterized protein RCC_06794 [Ramularia collo-cygni]|uniref:Uncharacterized protein n=1 Tax=Ramularia collo-cygni TaxID=112498 RepID=A0A2D3VJ65_9PEZI|nr:uncharacterized protein RCC_06794 [Ramularia collo-cygni]CZT20933.1 uncharacterized protein RCC_06794 [Ramularia collo-cygni]